MLLLWIANQNNLRLRHKGISMCKDTGIEGTLSGIQYQPMIRVEWPLIIIIFLMQYQKKKQMGADNQDEEISSSLGFLGSNDDKENNECDQDQDIEDDMDINILSAPSKKRKDQSFEYAEGNSNIPGIKKRQRSSQQQISGANIFLYRPDVQLPNLHHYVNSNIKVIIAAEYVTKENSSVVKQKIYGTDTYSSNSDCVCIGIHYGLLNFSTFFTKKYEGVQINFKVIKPKKQYVGSTKNGIVSHSIKNFNGSTLKPESSKMLVSLGSIQSLERYAANMRIPLGKQRKRNKPQNLNNIVPLPQCHLVFNMNNEPAFKYSIYNLGDKGFDKSEFLVKKLDTKVLYIQTQSKQRYELSKYIEKKYFEAYRLVKLKNPMKFDNEYFFSHSTPLSAHEDIQIIEELIEWDQIILGLQSIRIKEYLINHIHSFKFYSKDCQ